MNKLLPLALMIGCSVPTVPVSSNGKTSAFEADNRSSSLRSGASSDVVQEMTTISIDAGIPLSGATSATIDHQSSDGRHYTCEVPVVNGKINTCLFVPVNAWKIYSVEATYHPGEQKLLKYAFEVQVGK